MLVKQWTRGLVLGAIASLSHAQASPAITAQGSTITVRAEELVLSRQAGAAILLTNVASTAEATSLGLSSYISAAVADHATMDARISVAIATATSTGAQASSQLSAAVSGISAQVAGRIQSSFASAISVQTSQLGALSSAVAVGPGGLSEMAVAAMAQSSITASISAAVVAINSTLQPSGPGLGPGLPRTCRDVIRRNRSAASGMYTIQPLGQASFPAFCENDFYGGGWTMVEKINAGPFRANTQPPLLPDAAAFFQMVLNPTQDVNTQQMQTSTFDFVQTAPSWVASLNQAKTNAIAAATMDDGQAPVVRIDFKRCDTCAGTVGTYMQQLLDPPQNFNYWNALRDAVLWTNVTAGHYVVGYERNFVLAKNPSSFNSEKNVLLHDACGDRTFGAWGQFYTMVNGVNVSYSRHGGLIGDGHCNGGNQWVCTLQTTDPRFMNDAVRQSIVYIR
eukprot:m.42718 g.42718  ORF g.42718 m.42718 type:complete len:451 (+) comp14530_c0_seq2:45-1397(+)